MFKVNKLTDYATVVLISIARTQVVRSSQHISENTGIPVPTVAKIMKNLNKAGLVKSQRGASGGYSLGRVSSEITLADVIRAIDGPLAGVSGPTNAVTYSTDLLGEVTLVGPGAGGRATGFGLLSDLLDIHRFRQPGYFR